MPFSGGGSGPIIIVNDPFAAPVPAPGRGPGGPGNNGGGGGPPRSRFPASAAPTNLAATSANQAVALPTLYGTGKLTPLILERATPTYGAPPNWGVGLGVHIDEFYAANGNAYQCIAPGGTSVAPSGAGNPVPVFNAGIAVAQYTIRQANGNVYRSLGAGTTGSTAPSGTGSSISDGVVNWGYIGSATGFTIVTDGTIVWRYVQQLPCPIYTQFFVAGLCDGEAQGILQLWWDKSVASAGLVTNNNVTAHSLIFASGPEAGGQTLLPVYDSAGYQRTALLYAGAYALGVAGAPTGTQAEIPAIAAETQGVMFGVSTFDVNLADVVNDLLTHSRRGVSWPGSRVDASIGGGGATSLRTQLDALGLRCSLLLDSQRPVAGILSDIGNASIAAFFMGQGALKAVPLWDAAIASPVYGAVAYTPNLTAQFNLGPDDFLDQGGGVLLDIQRARDADTYNQVPVEYVDRGLNYSSSRVQPPVLSDAQKRGTVIAPTVQLPFIFPDGVQPTRISKIVANRSLYCRNTYTFRLPAWYIALEPGDIVAVSDPIQGVSLRPVRVQRATRLRDRTGVYIAVDCPQGHAASTPYTPQQGTGYVSNQPTSISTTLTAFPAANQTNQGADNLWPNPTSESNPPSGVVVKNDGTQPEWDYRLNLAGAAVFTGSITGTVLTVSATASGAVSKAQRISGANVAPGTYTLSVAGVNAWNLNISQTVVSESMTASGAFAGDWVRQLAWAAGGSQSLPLAIPCAAGEQFFFGAATQVGGLSNGVTLTINFLDPTGAVIAVGGTASHGGILADWTPLSILSTAAPTGTVTAQFVLKGSGSTSGSALFDSMVVRRVVQTAHVAPGTASQALVTDPATGATTWGQVRPAGLLPGTASQALVTDPGTGLTTWGQVQPAGVAPGSAGQMLVTAAGGATAWAGDTAWTAPTIGGSWTDSGAPFPTVGYRKDGSGVVHLRGTVTGPAIPVTLFVLPAGYRPAGTQEFACGGAVAARVEVDSSGNVIVRAGSTTSVSLDSISFFAG